MERLPVVVQILAANSKLYTHLVQKKTTNDVEVQAMPEANKDGFLRWRNDALFQLDINYRWSPIVLDGRTSDTPDGDELKAHAYQGYPGEGVRAGDRAPNAPALLHADGTETSLFSIFKPYIHTALAFSPVGDTTNHTAVALDLAKTYSVDVLQVITLEHLGRPAPVVRNDTPTYYDPNGYAYNEYGVGDSFTIVVVRPDGYIGAIVEDIRGVEKYFSRILKVA